MKSRVAQTTLLLAYANNLYLAARMSNSSEPSPTLDTILTKARGPMATDNTAKTSSPYNSGGDNIMNYTGINDNGVTENNGTRNENDADNTSIYHTAVAPKVSPIHSPHPPLATSLVDGGRYSFDPSEAPIGNDPHGLYAGGASCFLSLYLYSVIEDQDTQAYKLMAKLSIFICRHS
jgi:hypothetical protein